MECVATPLVPTDPHHRIAWIRQQLAARGQTLASIADHAAVSRQLTSKALRTPTYRGEMVLASALDMEPSELFPERYDEWGVHISLLSQVQMHGPKEGER